MRQTPKWLLALVVIAATIFPTGGESAHAVSANPTPDCSAGTTCTITFTYTGDYYAWTVPASGNYTLKVWGAQGGNGVPYSSAYSSTGGKGGYSTGVYASSAGATLNIYVGGAGGAGTTSGSSAGGWNGGGTASTMGMAGGGGASDVRVGGTAYANRIIVAGGGGGGGNAGDATLLSNGGPGGGLSAPTLSTSTQFGNRTPGSGGTQNSGYAIGLGSPSSGVNLRGAGGGGFYGGGVGDNSTGGGGGSSFVGSLSSASTVAGDSLMPNPSGGNMYGRSGNGLIQITYDNSPIPTTFSTAQTTPTKIGTSSTISYSLVLSQTVSDLATSDFQFGGTSSCNTPGLSGSGTTYTVTLTNCSEGTLTLQLKANSITGTSTGPPTISSANTIVIDRTAPTISSVTAPANSTYIPGNTPTFTVAFSESVTVTGTPRLTLTVGSATEYATYLSMSDSKTALFRYTVATDPTEFDTDGIAIATNLDLNSGSIADLATNALTNLTFTAPTLTSVLVAQPAAAPTIDSIVATSGTLTVYFTPGAARGSTTSNYQYSTNNGSTWTTRSPTATTSPLTIGSLTDGTSYTIRLRAVTNAGNSDSSTAVIETPTAISVTGDATLTLTYGSTASTSAYSALGGTNTFTWTLGSSISGITLSGTTVSASSSLAAGTYSQIVRATDGNNQAGTKVLTITVNKASTSISIALPNGATDAALGGAITITATVPRAGAVNFKLGGTTISGCGSAVAASTTATCSWTPGALGSVSLTAVFTPTDSSNYETSTTTTLTINVVNGVSTVSLSLTGGVTQTPKGQAINIIAAINQAGKVSFYVDGKRIAGCYNKSAPAGNKSCSWIPTVQKQVTITVTLNPTNIAYDNSTSSMKVWVLRRSNLR